MICSCIRHIETELNNINQSQWSPFLLTAISVSAVLLVFDLRKNPINPLCFPLERILNNNHLKRE